MRLPTTAQTEHPWRIHELVEDFILEDVWALPTPGGPDDFPRLVGGAIEMDPGQSSAVVAGLFALRWRIGGLLGWDDDGAGIGSRVPSLRDRLPDDLRERPGPEFAELPFRPLYLLDDELAAEMANRTVHGVMHLSWVEEDDGSYRGQMAVYVKRNGLFGAAYMAAIAPFRHLLVYPQMIRAVGQEWQRRADEPTPTLESLVGG